MQHISSLFVDALGIGVVLIGAFYAQWMVKDSMAKDAAARRLRAQQEFGN